MSNYRTPEEEIDEFMKKIVRKHIDTIEWVPIWDTIAIIPLLSCLPMFQIHPEQCQNYEGDILSASNWFLFPALRFSAPHFGSEYLMPLPGRI